MILYHERSHIYICDYLNTFNTSLKKKKKPVSYPRVAPFVSPACLEPLLDQSSAQHGSSARLLLAHNSLRCCHFTKHRRNTKLKNTADSHSLQRPMCTTYSLVVVKTGDGTNQTINISGQLNWRWTLEVMLFYKKLPFIFFILLIK